MSIARGSAVRQALWLFGGSVVVALVAPHLAPYAPTDQLDPVALASKAPSAAHLLGTDSYSRDVLSRLLHGASVSLGVASLAALLSLALGALVGGTAAIRGGFADAFLMRGTDAALAFPRVLAVLLVATLLGPTGPLALGLVLGGTGWMVAARLVRQETQRALASEAVRTARALGIPRGALWRHHILPSLVPTLAAAATITFAAAIPLEAGLSFLGLGVAAPAPSWGNIVADAEGRLLERWWLVLFPTLCVIACALAAHRVGERFAREAGGEA